MKLTEEEKKWRDNLALVAMQSIISKKPHLTLWERLEMLFNSKIEISRDPEDVAAEAYELANAMMIEREGTISAEEE